MVCESCLDAGKLVKIAGCTDDNTKVYLEQQALGLHKECMGGTWCDCQHKTEGVNWLALKPATLPA